MKVRKGDTVVIIAGKDIGKKGKVHRVLPKEDKIVVKGLNIIKRHSRTRGRARQAGIIELEAPLHVSNVMLLCSKCGKPARVGFCSIDDGRRVRVCRSCGEVID
ncbi:MAG: 50S ribosomal protein L24 [Dehalococcoidia bacterium]|nr:50S ribosomal protein L24 [Dehalococcoidia bacterium]